MKEIVIIGCGGHAKVVLSIIDLLDNITIIKYITISSLIKFYKMV